MRVKWIGFKRIRKKKERIRNHGDCGEMKKESNLKRELTTVIKEWECSMLVDSSEFSGEAKNMGFG